MTKLTNGPFVARNLAQGNRLEMDKAYAFRHAVFCRELGWQSAEAREKDGYDRTSVHFGVFDDSDELVGYCRLHLPAGPFMIENEFADLVAPWHRIRKTQDTVEASRFGIGHRLRRTKDGFEVTELLCKTMYLWARGNNVRYVYLVLDAEYLDFLLRFFPIQPIGGRKNYDHQMESIAVIVDLTKLGLKHADTLWDTLGNESKSG
jgi:acyl homoserine lactone synthase